MIPLGAALRGEIGCMPAYKLHPRQTIDLFDSLPFFVSLYIIPSSRY
jgi:hypothetical protein